MSGHKRWITNSPVAGLGGGRVRVPPFDRIFFANPLEREGFQIRMCVLRPKSRGEIRLASADPFAKPLIVSNCLSDGSDLELLLRGVEIARDVASKPSLARLIDAEIGPGSDVQSRETIERYIRQEAFAIFHPVGTCRMGTDGDAVVDRFLNVRGLDGLRVVDASVMPTITGGNTHGPTIMIAEKAADMIRGRTAAAPERLEAAA